MPTRSAQEQFDRQASHYNAQWNSWTGIALNWLLEQAECQPDDLVLDVATGTGFTALAFAPFVQSVVGIDVSTGMLEQARQQQVAQHVDNVTWQQGAAEALPFADETFSIVTCRIAPHHFQSIPQFLSEVKRVLRPHGRFLLADTCVPDEEPEVNEWQNRVEALRDPSHMRNLAPQEWQEALEAAGLHVTALCEPTSDIAMHLNDWMTKAGCTGDQAEAVRAAFAAAPAAAVRTFHIRELPTGDYAFAWQRVAAKAIKP
ncbi:class I SAM-dependent methyltransferase [Hymenobacter sp. GOD-10R]|uniref:class I SAM-dependent methyltransferase n=1 Tax=Hymenobacter sp. GOD-10R TaxID=3093922 RepID=UPI002D780BC9|nr:class I SAM-dependent methyltransferase [Hymenobacter sp. GOD-10R]WRQ29802.1 class I SAM-dependent methyltransferase [Hymenobacter sp. GOD-10R]